MDIHEIEKLNIKGFMNPEEGAALYRIAFEVCSMGPVLEVGGYCGKSTVYLGSACKRKESILFSIDHHRGSEEQQKGQEYFDPELYDERHGKVDTFGMFRSTIDQADLLETVVPIVTNSSVAARMWSTPLSMVFIDGGHTYPAVFSDYVSWSSHLMAGGILAIHDIFTDASKGGQAPYYIYKLALGSGLYEELPMIETLGILKKRRASDIPQELFSKRDW